MPSDATSARLRESAAEFWDIYNAAKEDSIFSGLVQEVDARQGFFKPAALALPGEPSEFTGTATVHTVATVSQSYETKVYEYTWGLDVNMIMRTDAISRGMLTSLLRGIGRKWVGHRDRKLTTVLATGESTGGLDGNAIFAATAYTPNPGITVDNIYGTSVSGSATEVLGALHNGLAHFEVMRSVGNDLAHGSAPRVVLMYAPTGQANERQSVWDALQPMLLNDKYRFQGSEVLPRANGYLGSNADMWLFAADYPDKFFVAGVEQEPDFVTTMGMSDSERILHRRQLGQTSYVYECAFSGNPYQGVMLNDA